MRKGRLLMFFLVAVCTLSGCKKKYEEVAVPEPVTTVEESTTRMELTTAVETEPETEAQPEEPEERIEVDGKIRSYLTGEMVDIKKANRRPIAIMMSNDKASLPQYGINRAGVVYEAPVEGTMNRYMAIIEDYDDLERIGSVRSCRTYYTFFAREFQAIYAHFGQSTFAKPYLKNVDNINGIEGNGSGAFYRSKDKKAPHNAYTSYSRIQNAINKLGYSQEYPKSYEGHYLFAKTGQEVHLENALDAYKIYPGYSMNKPCFSYHEEDGLYYRSQYGSAHKGSEGAISVKNIIFQYCPTGHYATTDYLNINVHANEYGYYITNGKAIPISWKKDGEFGVTHYYDTQNKEIVLNQGKTWICIIPTTDFEKTEIHGKDN
ncbi:MAG: DUF3048 domain-containing protein [Hungatella sp.]